MSRSRYINVSLIALKSMVTSLAAPCPSSAMSSRQEYDRAARTGMARIAELANLPMIAPAVLLGLGKRKGASRHTFLATQGL